MEIEKRHARDVFELDIEEINRDRICVDYALHNNDNYVYLLEEIGNYLIPLDSEYLYSEDSAWVKFFKANIANWFGEEHGFIIIDDGYWLLSLASVVDEDKSWDMSRIDLDYLDSARKLVKLMSVVGEIGSSMSKKGGT